MSKRSKVRKLKGTLSDFNRYSTSHTNYLLGEVKEILEQSIQSQYTPNMINRLDYYFERDAVSDYDITQSKGLISREISELESEIIAEEEALRKATEEAKKNLPLINSKYI